MLKPQGQSLSEYGLSIGLILMVCVGCIATLGGKLSDVFGLTIKQNAPSAQAPAPQQPSPQPGSVAQASPTPPDQSLIAGSGIGGVVPPPGPNQQQACLDNGLCVNVPVISDGAKVSVDAIGSNGVQLTLSFADMLQQVADQIQKSDPTDAAIISQLADAGHTLGNAQQAMGEICGTQASQCGSNEADNGYANYIRGVNQINTINQASTAFNTLYKNAQLQSLDPSAKSIVDLAVQHIDQIQNGYNVVQMGGRASEFSINNNTKLDLFNAQTIHENANLICSTGGNTNCIVPAATNTSGPH